MIRQAASFTTVPLAAALLLAAPGLVQRASAQSRLPDREFTIVTPEQTLVRYRSLGVQIRDVTPEDVKSAKLANDLGAYVTGVTEGSAAAQAGIKVGDVIVEFDGEAVRSAATLSRLVNETPSQREVKVAAIRDGKRTEFSVVLQRREGANTFSLVIPPVRPEFPDFPPSGPRLDQRPWSGPPGPQFAPPLWRFDGQGRMGIGLQDLTAQLRQYFGVRQGVLVASVTGNSPGARAGVKAGDIIVAVDGTSVSNASDVWRALGDAKAGDVVTLDIVRDRKPMSIKVTLGGPNARIRPIRER